MAKKHLGQNFLVDTNMINKITSSIVLGENNIEIGPGRGALTYAIAGKNPSTSIVLIEKDTWLANRFVDQGFKVMNADCLNCDLNCDVIFSSLPYNISSEFLLKLCKQVKYERVYLILQLDFIERILSAPSKNYGALSVLAQLHARLKLCFTISSQCFSPAPKVMSGFLCMQYKSNLTLEFIDFIYKCFSQRRKKLKNIIDVNCDKRPDQISPAEYVEIYKLVTGKDIVS